MTHPPWVTHPPVYDDLVLLTTGSWLSVGGGDAMFMPLLQYAGGNISGTAQQTQKRAACQESSLDVEFAKGLNNGSKAWLKDVAVGEGLAFAAGCIAGVEVGCLAPGGAAALAALPITIAGASLHAMYLSFKPVAQYAYNGYVCNNPEDSFF